MKVQTGLSLFCLSLLMSACGMSPQFNHTYPSRSNQLNHSTLGERTRSGNACDFYFAAQDLCATLEWKQEPNRDVEGAFSLYFWNRTQAGNSSSAPVLVEPNAASVFVKLWMPQMGHGSQKVKVEHTKTTQGNELAGSFEATEVMFVMPGNWEVVVQLKNASQTVLDSAKITYHAQ